MQESQVDMTVFEAILAKRCVRSYTAQAVSLDTIHILLEAAAHAPTALHHEPWAFAIIRDKQLLKDISNCAKPLFVQELQKTGSTPGCLAEPDFDIFYEASTLILICSKQTGPFMIADCWLAAENLMLAACAMKLGSCVIGAALTALNMPDIKVKLNIPEEFSVIAPIILGYPSGDTPPSPRKKPLILTLTS
ncbi:nitroreductase family protein [Nitrosomonas communis]|uniref:nitroreductase family protein n=1 Tax=Nitrosomonas communis TaxID=44574 RepID=UPI0026EB1298|nr:nitroreductase family protein [Nitrosomonas communis]MCO6427430.1 nitroreductase family protein [Nitrosomonas communis]